MQRSIAKGTLFLIFLLLCLQHSHSLFAQNYVLSNWTVEDGLSSDEGRDLFQDQDGFIWIATAHGLNKFDGYNFKKHRYHPSDSASIGANFINSFCKDDQGNIWMNLGVGVISKYDKLSSKFINYAFLDPHTYIRELHYLDDFGLCIATNQGLFTFDKQINKLALVETSNDHLYKDIYKIFPVKQGVYLTTANGFIFFNPATQTCSPTHLGEKIDSSNSIVKVPVVRLYEDSQGIIWIKFQNGLVYSSTDGIHFVESFSNLSKAYYRPFRQSFLLEDKHNNKWLSSNSGHLFTYQAQSQSWKPFASPPTDPIRFAFTDQDKSVWVCTQNHKFLKWNGKEWDLILNFGHQLKSWEINNVFIDNKNGIWLSSSSKGVWRIYNRKWPINSLKEKQSGRPIEISASALFSDHQDFMWVGSSGALYKYYFKTESLLPVFRGNSEKNPLQHLSVVDISKSTSGSLWVGTNKGLLILKKDEITYQQLEGVRIEEQDIGFGYVRSVEADSGGKTWIGSTNGLFMYAPEKERFYRYHPTKDSISGGDVQCIYQLSKNQYLVGYIKSGADLLTFHPEDYSVSSQAIKYFSPTMRKDMFMTVNTFYQTDTDIWLGNFSKGLLKLDLETLTVSPLSETFPIIPNVKAIQQAENGHLWVSSIDGIRNVNPLDQTFYRFTKASGLLNNRFFFNSSVQDSLGHLYFGGPNGLNKIQPANWNIQDTLATPILTEFKKYDERITSDTFLNELKTIPLSYQDDFITLEFVSPTFDSPGDVLYAYQLEGFDEQWRYCETRLSATYTNLPPGAYTFKVRAGNKGGFSNSKIKQLIITVSPPFWQTAWFGFIAIIALLFVYGLALKIQSNWRASHLRMVAKVRKKTADDFHDELGHRLTKIVLFVETLMRQQKEFPSKSAPVLRKIQDNANALYYSTKDFIWAMNPSKDSALELLVLLRDFGDELFADTDIQFSVEGLKDEYEDYMLDMDWKRQLVMIFKEAMNNALKHSKAESVILKVEDGEKHLKIALIDNGQGFVLNHKKFGYGLGSMLNRSKKIGGELKIKSLHGKGTEVSFSTLKTGT